jgi:UrcA family protein
MYAPAGTPQPMKLHTARAAAFAAALAIMVFTWSWPDISHAATPRDKLPTATVKYTDLDLSTDAGVAALYLRIQAAARQVCPGEHSLILSDVVESESCQAVAVARAIAAFNSPRLAMLHAAHSPRG